jgi:hypothetical protein
MSCKWAKRYDMSHAECEVSGEDCMYMRPNSLACRSEYLEGPYVTGNEHYYTIIYEEYEPYVGKWFKNKTRIWADTKKEAVKNLKKLATYKVRNFKVLPLFREIKDYIMSDSEHPTYKNIIKTQSGYSIGFILKNEKLSGVALTEKSIIIQYYNEYGKLQQDVIPITEELKELL